MITPAIQMVVALVGDCVIAGTAYVLGRKHGRAVQRRDDRTKLRGRKKKARKSASKVV